MKLLAALLLAGCLPSPQDFTRDVPAWICHADEDAGVLECIEVVEV